MCRKIRCDGESLKLFDDRHGRATATHATRPTAARAAGTVSAVRSEHQTTRANSPGWIRPISMSATTGEVLANGRDGDGRRLACPSTQSQQPASQPGRTYTTYTCCNESSWRPLAGAVAGSPPTCQQHKSLLFSRFLFPRGQRA